MVARTGMVNYSTTSIFTQHINNMNEPTKNKQNYELK